jgi:hypothetical protein
LVLAVAPLITSWPQISRLGNPRMSRSSTKASSCPATPAYSRLQGRPIPTLPGGEKHSRRLGYSRKPDRYSTAMSPATGALMVPLTRPGGFPGLRTNNSFEPAVNMKGEPDFGPPVSTLAGPFLDRPWHARHVGTPWSCPHFLAFRFPVGLQFLVVRSTYYTILVGLVRLGT